MSLLRRIGLVAAFALLASAAGSVPIYPGVLDGGQYNAAGISLSDGQLGGLQLDNAGRLVINCGLGCSGSAPAATVVSTIIPANTNIITVVSGAHKITAIDVVEAANGAGAYINVYDSITAACGTGTPKYRTFIAGNTSGLSGMPLNIGASPDSYSTGIQFCVHTGFGDADNTAPAANTYIVNVHYE